MTSYVPKTSDLTNDSCHADHHRQADANQPANVGRVTQIIGSTFDAEFPEDHLPAIYNAVKVTSSEQRASR